jgi:ESAT-6 family protein
MELDGLKVVHSGLDQAADDLMAIVSTMDARLQRLEQDLGPLRSAWIGEAQEAYSEAKSRWEAAVTEMRDLLRHTSQQVAQANASYHAADARGARAFGI